MKLSIVIIHYNTSEDLGRCLGSLRRYPPSCDHAVTVVDNASTDPGLDAVRAEHPEARWLMNERNAGYSRGANQGMAEADADYWLILNPDIVIRPGALDALLAFADRTPRAGIVGPQLLNEDGSVQESCRRFYTFATLLMRRTIVGKIWRNTDIVDRHLMRDFDHASNRTVDWVLGGCMLVRREAVERVGPMDERFFLYFEDVDWCTRMGRAGWDVVYTPEASFVHRHRRESAKGVTGRSFWLHLGSLFSFFEKWSMVVWLLKRWRDPLGSLLLWVGDAAALNVAFAGAWGVRRLMDPLFAEALYPLAEYRPLQLYATLLMTLTFAWQGRYRVAATRVPTAPAERVQQVGVVALLLLASTFLSHQDVYSRAVLLLFVPLFALIAEAVERLLRRGRDRMEEGWLSLDRCLLVGDHDEVARWLEARGDLRRHGLDAVGRLRTGPGDDGAPLAGGDIPCLGEEADLAAIVERYRISQVLFWRLPRHDLRELRTLARLRARRIRLRWCVAEGGLLEAGARPDTVGGGRGIVLDPGPARPATTALARLAAVVLGTVLFVPSLLLRLFAALAPGLSVEDRDVGPAVDPASCWRVGLVVRSDGGPAPLPWQAGLFAALVRGRLELTGPPLVFTGSDSTPIDHDQADPWLLEVPRAGLWPDGTWRDPIRNPAGLSGGSVRPDREV